MRALVLFSIFTKEVADAAKNRWFAVMTILFVLLSLTLSWMGAAGLGTLGASGFSRTAASLVNLTLLIVPLMGLVLGSISLASERENGTLLTLLSQPVTSSEIFLGKWMGCAFSLIAAVWAGFAVSGFVIARWGIAGVGQYMTLVLYTSILGLVFLSLGFFIAVFLKRTVTALSLSILIWFIFIFLSDLAVMGGTIALQLKPMHLFWLTVLNPAQSFKIAVIGGIQNSLETFGATGLFASELFGDTVTVVFISVLIVWIVWPLAFSLWRFRKTCVD